MYRSLIAIFFFFSVSMYGETHVLTLCGSTRSASLNKHLLSEATNYLKDRDVTVTFFDLKRNSIPFYDGDLEANQGMPEQAKALRSLLLNSDFVIIASPEYNGSYSAVLKNALDWASRSEQGGYSQVAFKRAKFLLISASPGSGGGARGLAQLRTLLTNVGANVLPDQLSVSRAHEQLGREGASYRQELAHLLKKSIN